MKIGVLVSGDLGLNLLKYLSCKNRIIFVMTDKSSLGIIEFCNEKNWPVFTGNPRKGTSKNFLKRTEIDVLISVNYLFLIEEDLISLPKKFAFNIHGSLLPKYRGRTPHVWAIINNEKETGITAHLIEKGCDTGPIIEQVKVPIEADDTGHKILEKFKMLYPSLVDTVLEKITSNNLQPVPQEDFRATFFGKRTPADGEISWNWQKERICNWVRAQAYPYPGAYSHCNGEKVIIDEVEFTEDGYFNDMINGLILSTEPLKVKTPNGVIKIKKIRNKQFTFHEGEILK